MMTGWHDYEPHRTSIGWHAHSEYFIDNTPLDPILIAAAFGRTPDDAKARRDREKPFAGKRLPQWALPA